MKHHITIYCGISIVENMMSSISTPSELRARLAKKYPGKYALYFRTIDANHGWFSNGCGVYQWFIDSDPTERQRKPKIIQDLEFRTNPKSNSLYVGDVITFPTREDAELICKTIRGTNYYYLIVKLNAEWQPLRIYELCKFDGFHDWYDAFQQFAGKTIKITTSKAVTRIPRIKDRGLITGKPLKWWMCPTGNYDFTYEVVK